MTLHQHRFGRFTFRIHSNGWFIVVDEKLLASAVRRADSSNPAYRRLKKLFSFSNSECFRFLVGYHLYATGGQNAPEAAFFCSFLD